MLPDLVGRAVDLGGDAGHRVRAGHGPGRRHRHRRRDRGGAGGQVGLELFGRRAARLGRGGRGCGGRWGWCRAASRRHACGRDACRRCPPMGPLRPGRQPGCLAPGRLPRSACRSSSRRDASRRERLPPGRQPPGACRCRAPAARRLPERLLPGGLPLRRLPRRPACGRRRAAPADACCPRGAGRGEPPPGSRPLGRQPGAAVPSPGPCWGAGRRSAGRRSAGRWGGARHPRRAARRRAARGGAARPACAGRAVQGGARHPAVGRRGARRPVGDRDAPVDPRLRVREGGAGGGGRLLGRRRHRRHPPHREQSPARGPRSPQPHAAASRRRREAVRPAPTCNAEYVIDYSTLPKGTCPDRCKRPDSGHAARVARGLLAQQAHLRHSTSSVPRPHSAVRPPSPFTLQEHSHVRHRRTARQQRPLRRDLHRPAAAAARQARRRASPAWTPASTSTASSA